MADKDDTIYDQRIQNAVVAEIPHLYANGFAISLTTSDALVVLERNGVPQATLNLSFTAAKTLAIRLGGTVALLENSAKRPMLTTDEIEKLMGESRE